MSTGYSIFCSGLIIFRHISERRSFISQYRSPVTYFRSKKKKEKAREAIRDMCESLLANHAKRPTKGRVHLLRESNLREADRVLFLKL